ncbi:MAG: four helix bundle protein [Bacteroidales bacterium]|nr:four helix bundle protein [Bacteroidales bacterium]
MKKEKPYDLGERTFLFALAVAKLVNKLPKTLSNIEYSKQVIKSSDSVGANYTLRRAKT